MCGSRRCQTIRGPDLCTASLQSVDDPLDSAAELAALLNQPNPPIDRALLLVSQCFQQRAGVVERGLAHLDEWASRIHIPTQEPGATLEMVDALIGGLFGTGGFVGDVENYHGEENSFLDRVLERQTGMPITLGVVVVAVGSRLGLPLELIGLPGHVVVRVPTIADTFIDAFSGTRVDRAALDERMRSIFGHDIQVDDQLLTPMPTSGVVIRVCNNLMRSWADDHRKFDRLLEVRSLLPLEPSDQRMLIDIAEARARFDIAAKLRATIDPDDPEINALWGRLN